MKALVVNKSDKMFYYHRWTSAMAYGLHGGFFVCFFSAMVVEGSEFDSLSHCLYQQRMNSALSALYAQHFRGPTEALL